MFRRKTADPVHRRSAGYPTRDAVAEVDRFDATRFDSRGAGVSFELEGLGDIEAGADIVVALLVSLILIAIGVAVAAFDTAGASAVVGSNLSIAERVSGESPSRVRCLSARIIRTLFSRS